MGKNKFTMEQHEQKDDPRKNPENLIEEPHPVRPPQRLNDDYSGINDAVSNDDYLEDDDPPLTEEDLEENNLSIEEADQIEWDEWDEPEAGDWENE